MDVKIVRSQQKFGSILSVSLSVVRWGRDSWKNVRTYVGNSTFWHLISFRAFLKFIFSIGRIHSCKFLATIHTIAFSLTYVRSHFQVNFGRKKINAKCFAFKLLQEKSTTNLIGLPWTSFGKLKFTWKPCARKYLGSKENRKVEKYLGKLKINSYIRSHRLFPAAVWPDWAHFRPFGQGF
jgi:hypothetical protein